MKIERKAGNVRFGSREWARRQKGPWTWRHVTYNYGGKGIEFLCGDKLIAVVEDDWGAGATRADFAQAYAKRWSIELGGETIGPALLYDFCEYVAAGNCDTGHEDKTPLEFT
jgi:hypothetical protein